MSFVRFNSMRFKLKRLHNTMQFYLILYVVLENLLKVYWFQILEKIGVLWKHAVKFI